MDDVDVLNTGILQNERFPRQLLLPTTIGKTVGKEKGRLCYPALSSPPARLMFGPLFETFQSPTDSPDEAMF